MAFRNRKLSEETKLRISKANKLVIMAVVVLMLGSFSSSCSYVSATPSQSANHHHKVSDKKQDSGGDSNDGGSSSRDASNSGRSSGGSDKTLGHTDHSSSDSDRGSSTSDTKF